jgi:hypothetical protein
MKTLQSAKMVGGPHDGTWIDLSLTLCEALTIEDEHGYYYVRRGTTYERDGEAVAVFQWEPPYMEEGCDDTDDLI